MKIKRILLISIFLISSRAHRESVQYDLSSKPTSFNIQNNQLKVMPYKRVSFNQHHDVLMLKFIASRNVELDKILADQIAEIIENPIYCTNTSRG